jgi:ankyrin repeat protein
MLVQLGASTLLLEAGCHINVSDHDGRTPLMLAATAGNVQLIGGCRVTARGNVQI